METGQLTDPSKYHAEVTNQIRKTVDWGTPGLRIKRLRLLSDPGFPFWDVSYCHGELNGEAVEVSLPFSQLYKPNRHPKKLTLAAQIVEHAKKDRVYAAETGIFQSISAFN